MHLFLSSYLGNPSVSAKKCKMLSVFHFVQLHGPYMVLVLYNVCTNIYLHIHFYSI